MIISVEDVGIGNEHCRSDENHESNERRASLNVNFIKDEEEFPYFKKR